jgi:tetratricopeptide (TPR) repeat protein
MTTSKSGLSAFLAEQTAELLAQWLCELAQQDGQAEAFLKRKIESATLSVGVEQRIRAAIVAATTLPDDLNPLETSKIAVLLEAIVSDLEQLLQSQGASLLVELSEYAIEQIEQALEQINDVNGDIGGVLENIGALHLQACMIARPDPLALAERLFGYEATFLLETFLDSARTYQIVLGEVGLQRFYELAETEWRRFESASHQHQHDGNGIENRRWRITHIVETLAQLMGNLEQWVNIKSRDLSQAHHYLQIATMVNNAGRTESALDWAERGLHAFPERPDNRLRDFLADLYMGVGRNEDALELIWIQMETQPNLEHYRKLCEWSTRFGMWPFQRERAMQRVIAVTEQEARMINRWRPVPAGPDQTLLVEIALWENDISAAWRYAQAGQVRREVLLALVLRLETVQQTAAIALYRRLLDSSLKEGGDWGYLDMANLLKNWADLMLKNARIDEAKSYLAQVQQQFSSDAQLQKILSQVQI